MRWLLLLPLLALAACGGGGRMGPASLECVPYARAHSGIVLYGDAASWWDQAGGRYQRSAEPVPGGVLVLRRTARLPAGHVAVVREQVSPREIRVDQANWVRGRVTTGEPVIDVSPANDWTAIRVWWDPAGSMGVTTYPAYGFIGPGQP